MFQNNQITIYTDGSSRGNPGPGGFASIIIFNKDKVLELGGRSQLTTNNKMELRGVIEAFKIVSNKVTQDIGCVKIYSDSKYVLTGITEWIHGWKKNGWRTAAKKSVLNQDLWQELDLLVETVSQQQIKIEWNYVKGHADNPYNNRADIIATTCADMNETVLQDGNIKIFYDDNFENWKKTFDKI